LAKIFSVVRTKIGANDECLFSVLLELSQNNRSAPILLPPLRMLHEYRPTKLQNGRVSPKVQYLVVQGAEDIKRTPHHGNALAGTYDPNGLVLGKDIFVISVVGQQMPLYARIAIEQYLEKQVVTEIFSKVPLEENCRRLGQFGSPEPLREARCGFTSDSHRELSDCLIKRPPLASIIPPTRHYGIMSAGAAPASSLAVLG
jgi:hypothetical protein